MKEHPFQVWRTADELRYIEKLDRQKLVAYLTASEKRTDWGWIDKTHVLNVVKRRLMTRG